MASARRLQAITALEERVLVLAHRGQIHSDIGQSNQVFNLLDQLVDDVHIDKVSFHPKVWLLKYQPRHSVEERTKRKVSAPSTGAIYRLLCTSKNLTLSSNWEAVVSLEGRLTKVSLQL